MVSATLFDNRLICHQAIFLINSSNYIFFAQYNWNNNNLEFVIDAVYDYRTNCLSDYK